MSAEKCAKMAVEEEKLEEQVVKSGVDVPMGEGKEGKGSEGDSCEASENKGQEGDANKREESIEEHEKPKSPKKSPKKIEPEKGEKKPERKRTAKDKERGDEADEKKEEGQTGDYWNIDSGAKRQRKSLDHFHPESHSKDKEDVVEKILQQGKGMALKDIPSVHDAIKDHIISKADRNDHLKMLSQHIFKKIFSPRELKENLLNFSGMVFEDQKQDENWTNRFMKRTIAELKGMLGCLHLERAGTQVILRSHPKWIEQITPGTLRKIRSINHGDLTRNQDVMKELAERIIEFLKKPTASMAEKGKAVSGSKKRKSSGAKKSASKSSKAKASGPKKAAKKKKEADSNDDDEDDDDDDDDQEEEMAKPPPKKAKKAKKVDDDDNSADEPLVAKVGGIRLKLKEYVDSICSKADLGTLTLRMVREKLETEYKVDIAEHKDEIKKIVNDYVAKHST